MIFADMGISPTSMRSATGREAERKELAAAGELIDKTLSLMRFPARLEQQFLQDVAPQRLRYFIFSGWLSLLVFNGFLLVDYLLADDVIWLAVRVRVFYFTPPAVALLMIGTFAQPWVLRSIPPLMLECLVVGSGVAAAAALAYILSASHNPMSQYYHVGLMVVVMYGNIVQRLRFWYAVLFSLTLYAIHIGGVLMIPAFNTRLILPMVGLLGATIAFTLMANYAYERDERRQYLLAQRRKHVLMDLSDVQKRLQRLSRVDALTGVYNRRHFDEYLAQVWRRAQHDGQSLAIIMVDVDHFKRYNDHYGHPAGDACLVNTAKAMQDALRRPGDLVARLGGEEFAAILPRANADVAQAAAERLRLAIRALQIPHAASSTAPIVTASVGVASVQAEPRKHPQALLSAADAALYQAKREGRDRVACQPD
jgi:diguanylate cyclase (GGDEF)-like protein